MASKDWESKFIICLAQTGVVKEACELAGVSRARAYELRNEEGEFAAQWAEALENATDVLESVARKRATEGSDAVLMFLLRSYRPKVFREPRVLAIATTAMPQGSAGQSALVF